MSEGRAITEGNSATTWVDQPRVDLRAKVTGRGVYIEDAPEPPGTARAAALRSPYAHARIGAIDSSQAEQLPGVLAVLHRDTLDRFEVKGAPSDWRQEFIAVDRARFDGDLIGMVVAEDARTAYAATGLIEVDYEILDPLFSAVEALAPGAPLIYEQLDSNLAVADSMEWGDVNAGMQEADVVFTETFRCPNIFHHPIEPASSFLVDFTGDTIDFFAPTNNPYDLVRTAARVLGWPRDRVRVRVPYIGGNFGSRHVLADMLAAAVLSRQIQRPVKVQMPHGESFRSAARHAVDFTATIGLTADGIITALDVDLVLDTGAYITWASVVTANALTSSWGAYRVPHFRARARTAYTNKVSASVFRNTGKNQTSFALDCLMDTVARRMGINPLDLRMQNLMRRGEKALANTWKRAGEVSPMRMLPLDTDPPELIQRATAAIGWDGRTPTPHTSGERVSRGRGIAISLRRGSGIGEANARVTVDRQGIVSVEHNAPEVGEGAMTMISVVAAHTLSVPQDQIVVGEPDTANELEFAGTSSQRTTVQMGTAVRNACDQLLQELARVAAGALGGTPEEWSVVDGTVTRGVERHSFAEVVRASGMDTVSGQGSYTHDPARDTSFGAHDYWSPGVAAVELEVDRETGAVRLLQIGFAADAGKVLHYRSAAGQLEGGIVMGIGSALTEELHYDEGQLINADAFQYRLPLMRDMPEKMISSMLENGDGPGPFGSKGISQVSIPCVAPAVGNAIADAIGVRLTSIPFTPEKILRALGTIQD